MNNKEYLIREIQNISNTEKYRIYKSKYEYEGLKDWNRYWYRYIKIQ